MAPQMNSLSPNSDSKEIKKFEEISHKWWDKRGPFRGLHEMNPLRVSYVSNRAKISNKRILDIGCGGGILCEALAKIGGHVTGIDLNTAGLCIAEKHAAENHLAIQYQNISVEDLAGIDEHAYDVITCMELLEHVPDPFSVIRSCKKLVKPGGHVFFFHHQQNIQVLSFGHRDG